MKSLLPSNLISIYILSIYLGQCQCSDNIGTQIASMYDLKVHSGIYGKTLVIEVINQTQVVDNLSSRLVFETDSSSFDCTQNGAYSAASFVADVLSTPTSTMATLITFDSVADECYDAISFNFIYTNMSMYRSAAPLQDAISINNYSFKT